MSATHLPCPHEGCPGLEMHNGKPDGCGHPGITEGCPHASNASLWRHYAAQFSLDSLAVFERHGATVETHGERHGCWVKLPNGWMLSIQWGGCMYGSNYDERAGSDVPPATTAEVAAWREGGDGMVTWANGDTVLGYCSMERVQHILDLLAEDTLMQTHQSEELRAVDGWREVEA